MATKEADVPTKVMPRPKVPPVMPKKLTRVVPEAAVLQGLENIQRLTLDTLSRGFGFLRNYALDSILKRGDKEVARAVAASANAITQEINTAKVNTPYLQKAVSYFKRVGGFYVFDPKAKTFVIEVAAVFKDYVAVYQMADIGIAKLQNADKLSEIATDIDGYTKLIDAKFGRVRAPAGAPLDKIRKFDNLSAIRTQANSIKGLVR